GNSEPVARFQLGSAISGSLEMVSVLDENDKSLVQINTDGATTIGNSTVNAATVKLVLQGTASQAADYLQILNSSAATLAKVTSTGKLYLALAPQIDIASAATGYVLTATDADGNTVF